MTTRKAQGVFCPVLTPFNSDYSVSTPRFIKHCQNIIDQGAGLAVFGTNSEANSLSLAEKLRLLDTLIEAGIPADRLMPGTGSCSIEESIALTRHATELGCAGALMLPPFYYKGVPDEGLYRNFAHIIDTIADARLRIYLYHIPQVSQVAISLPLIERLLRKYPKTIAGVKDSSGNWDNTQAMLRDFQPEGFDVFSGSETFLLATLRAGGAGCITATANVNASPIVALANSWQKDAADADAQQAQLIVLRKVFEQFPVIAAMKHTIAWQSQDSEWRTTRPPLVELDATASQKLEQDLSAIDYRLHGAETLQLA